MNLNTSLTLKPKWFFYILIGMVWCQSILMQYFRAVVVRLPIIGTTPDAVIVFMYIVVILFALREIKIRLGDLIGILAVMVVYLLSPSIAPDTFSIWQENSLVFLIQVLPMYFVGVAIVNQKDDRERILYFLYILSIISVVVRIIYHYTSGAEMTEAESLYKGDMEGAYELVPHLCLIIYYAVKKKGFINISVLAVGSVFLLFLGSRGPVLVEVICFTLIVLFFAKWKYKALKITLISVALIVFLYSPLLEDVVLKLYDIAYDMGLSVRIFDHFLNGEIINSTGRDIISVTLYESLSDNPLGYGIYADRLLANGSYAHKIYLELWIHFGVILGTIICAFFLLIPIYAFLKAENKDIKGFLIVLYCSGVIKLFLSGSYLQESLLFLVLGVSYALIEKTRDGTR